MPAILISNKNARQHGWTSMELLAVKYGYMVWGRQTDKYLTDGHIKHVLAKRTSSAISSLLSKMLTMNNDKFYDADLDHARRNLSDMTSLARRIEAERALEALNEAKEAWQGNEALGEALQADFPVVPGGHPVGPPGGHAAPYVGLFDGPAVPGLPGLPDLSDDMMLLAGYEPMAPMAPMPQQCAPLVQAIIAQLQALPLAATPSEAMAAADAVCRAHGWGGMVVW